MATIVYPGHSLMWTAAVKASPLSSELVEAVICDTLSEKQYKKDMQ